jgi:hypothetical protein
VSSTGDPSLVAQVDTIKFMKPKEPGGINCIDFALGDSGYGVRHILTFNGGHGENWAISTSIGIISPDKYEPMPLDGWTTQLRVSATQCINEVLACFNVDEASKQVNQGHSIVVFRFKETT